MNKILISLILIITINIAVGGVSDKKPSHDTNSDAGKATVISTACTLGSYITCSSESSVILFSSMLGLLGIGSSLYAINIVDLETDTGKIFCGWNSIMCLISFCAFVHAIREADYSE